MTRREPPIHHDGRSIAPTEHYEKSDPAHLQIQINRLKVLVDALVVRFNDFQRAGVELATRDYVWGLEQRIEKLEGTLWWYKVREWIMTGIIGFLVLWAGMITGIAAAFAWGS